MTLLRAYLFTILLICFEKSVVAKTLKLDPLPQGCILEGRFGNKNGEIFAAYPASALNFSTNSKSCVVFISEKSSKRTDFDFIGIEVNGQYREKLQLSEGVNAVNLSKYIHTDSTFFRIIKLTEAMVGSIGFQSIQINDSSSLLQAVSSDRKILWVGNSLTCGYGNELSIPAPPQGNPSTGFHAKNENNYFSWSSITTRKLNASAHQICYSGKGIYRNFDGKTSETLPHIFTRIYPDQMDSENYPWEKFIPDLIVINLGTNDFGQELYSKNPDTDSLLFCNAYQSFLDSLNNYYPLSKIILVIGNALSDEYPSQLKRLSRCKKWITAIQQNNPKMDIHCFELTQQSTPFGEDWHPTRQTHEKMSNQIIPFILNLMKW